MLRVRRSCLELSQLRLHALRPGAVYSLQEMEQVCVCGGGLSELRLHALRPRSVCL